MNKKTLKNVIKCLSPFKFLIILSVLFSLINVFFTLYIPMLIGDAVNLIIGKNNVDFAAIFQILIRAVIYISATALSAWLMNIINNRISFGAVRSLRERAISKLHTLPLSYLDSHRHGETLSRIITDVDQFSDGLILGFSGLITGIATLLGALIFMITLNGWITVAVVVLTPISLLIAKFIASRTYTMFQKQTATRGEQTAFIDEMISNQKVVKAFSQEENAKRKFDEINERLEKHSLSAIFFSSLVNPTTRFINSIIYAAVALLGALFAANGIGGITVGAFTSMLVYVNHYTKPFNEITGIIAELQGSFAAIERLFNFLDEDSEEADPLNAKDTENIAGNFHLEKVSFSYDKNSTLIENLNLNAKSGQRIAIVGPTGCGKTTVINLLMRFYDVDSGSIELEDVDIRDMSRHHLRSHYGMVLQDTWLKKGSIYDNIRLGKPDATDDEVIEAAKAAHAHGFITRLKDGYNTIISEDGESLSQGQKQLLCISRIMLCLPPILILDEATSSIDTMTEIRIQKAFAKLMDGKTSFIVAHRLSTIKNADIILVMKDGNVIEQGSHKELIDKKGFYYELYNCQFK